MIEKLFYGVRQEGYEKKISAGVGRFPWWLGGKESSCQYRRHKFNPWSGKIPHAAGQLSPCAIDYWACALDPQTATTEALTLEPVQQEKPAQWEACALQRGVASACLQLKKISFLSAHRNEEPAQSINKSKTKEQPPTELKSMIPLGLLYWLI